jgi:formate-dependent nitrite reductase cytochrome c552 subunit
VSFTDGKPCVVTPRHLETRWGGYPAKDYFRCRMCGHHFVEGDVFRWVYTNNLPNPYGGNPIVCTTCDGPDVIDRWKALCDEAHSGRFWWFMFDGGLVR